MRKKLWDGWEVSDKIGEGRTGDVYKAVKNVNGMFLYCAVKYISLPRSIQEVEQLVKDGIIKDKSEAVNYYSKVLDGIKKEISIMQKFNGNSYIMDCYDYYQETKASGMGFDFYLRMELASDVVTYFDNLKDVTLDVIQLGIDICTALELCCKNGIIHRDIKPNNIFIGNDGKFKLGDFGLASDTVNNNSDVIGTYNYMAPEVYNKEKVDNASDLYSLGIVMYKFLNNGKLPFVSNIVNEDKAFKLRMSGFKVNNIRKVDKDLMNIVLKACNYNKQDRYNNPTSMKKDLLSVMKKYNEDGKIRKTINVIPSSSSLGVPDVVRDKQFNSDKTVSIYDAKMLEKGDSDSGIINNVVEGKTNYTSSDGNNRNDNNIHINNNEVKDKILNYFKNLKENFIGFYNDNVVDFFKKVTDKDFLLKNKWKILVGVMVILFILFLRGCVFSERKCKEGYINRLGMCVEGYYTCSKGYVLNSDNKCSKTLKSVDANGKYSCDDDYTLQDKYCIKSDTKDPVGEFQCAGLGTLKGDKCVQEQSTDAAITYECPSGFLYYDGKCSTISNQTAKSTYYCPSGYKLSGSKCTKTEYTNPTSSGGSYNCNSGETLNGSKCYINATCNNGYDYSYCKWYPSAPGCSSSQSNNCTCPSGYTKSGTQCYRNATYSSGNSYCAKGTLSGGRCVSTTTIAAAVKYTCSNGYSVYGNQCIKTSSVKPTQKYYCAGGLTLKGNRCIATITVDAVKGYKCDEGYVLAGTTCMLNDKKDAKVEYSCSKVYTLNGSKCEKYDLKRPTAHYGSQK